jgi:hypothetical protein
MLPPGSEMRLASAQGPAYAVAREKHDRLGRLIIPGQVMAVTASGIMNVKSIAMYPEGPLAGIQFSLHAVLLILFFVFGVRG